MDRAVMFTQGTLLMAMAHGLPVVSTPTHHALELLYDSRGLLVHYNDNGTALAEGLNALLKSSSLRSTMVSTLFLAFRDYAYSIFLCFLQSEDC